MPIRAIIFDLDGTLADTLPDLTTSVNVAMEACGLPQRSAAEVRQWIGSGLAILCQRAIAGEAGPAAEVVDDGQVAAMMDAFKRHYREHLLDETRAYPAIPLVLDELTARGAGLAVLSNKPHDHVVPMMDALFNRWRWQAIEGVRDGGTKKPDPTVALEILRRFDLPAREVMLVGDSGIDVATARAAGFVAVAVTWGFRDRDELVAAGPQYLIDDPQQLLSLVPQIPPRSP